MVNLERWSICSGVFINNDEAYLGPVKAANLGQLLTYGGGELSRFYLYTKS